MTLHRLRLRHPRQRRLLAVASVATLVVAATAVWTAMRPAEVARHVLTSDGVPAGQDTPDLAAEAGLPGGVQAALPLAGPVGPRVLVPILMYHYIRTDTSNNALGVGLSVTPALFAEEMRLLAIEGGHPITFTELLAALHGSGRLPAHPVILTFDDGYADFATRAEPILAALGFRAIDYVVSGFIDRRGYMTADQVRHADASGMVIGSHTVHHLDLAMVPPAMARAEITGGKAALEQLLGHPVRDFAYPYGGFDGAVSEMVQQAGFRDAVTTMAGSVETLGGRYVLPRLRMGGSGQNLAAFAAAVGLAAPTPALTAALARAPAPFPVSAGPEPTASPAGSRRS